MRGRDLYAESIAKWGVSSQIEMAIEEMSECILALQHLKRGRADGNKVAEEVADVRIMMKQLERIVGPDRVYAWETMKTQRLERRIDDVEDAQMYLLEGQIID